MNGNIENAEWVRDAGQENEQQVNKRKRNILSCDGKKNLLFCQYMSKKEVRVQRAPPKTSLWRLVKYGSFKEKFDVIREH